MFNSFGVVVVFVPLLVLGGVERIGQRLWGAPTLPIRPTFIVWGVGLLIVDVWFRWRNLGEWVKTQPRPGPSIPPPRGERKAWIVHLLLTPVLAEPKEPWGAPYRPGQSDLLVIRLLGHLANLLEKAFASFHWGRQWLAGANGGMIFCLPVWLWGSVLAAAPAIAPPPGGS